MVDKPAQSNRAFSFSSTFFKIFVRTLLIFISLGGVLSLQSLYLFRSHQQLTSTHYQRQTEEELALNAFRHVPSLGLANLTADWLYLQFIQYFGDNNARSLLGYSLAPKYFEQVIDRDPNFNDAISKLDVATSLFAGKPKDSVDLLAKSLQKQPGKFNTQSPSYYLWRAKGNNELLFLGNTQSAKESYSKSILSAQAYGTEDSKRIIEISQRSLKFLESNPNSNFARISAWVSVLGNRPDSKTMERVMQEIEALGGKVIFSPDGVIVETTKSNIN